MFQDKSSKKWYYPNLSQITRANEARGQSAGRESVPDAERTRRFLEEKWAREQREWEEANAKKLKQLKKLEPEE